MVGGIRVIYSARESGRKNVRTGIAARNGARQERVF